MPPRYPYGFYCQVRDGLSDSQMAERLDSWLKSGEAYQEFLAMNVCRSLLSHLLQPLWL
jgi:hypothetical protein